MKTYRFIMYIKLILDYAKNVYLSASYCTELFYLTYSISHCTGLRKMSEMGQ